MNLKICVVIPCYKVSKSISSVVSEIPPMIDYIVLVDDKSPDNTLQVLSQIHAKDERVHVVNHQKNTGVGGAMISGFNKAFQLGCDIILKMDGDGQMDPDYIQSLVEPIRNNQCHFSKGNRFNDFNQLRQMPLVRQIGNLGLSFLIKAASGYWSVFDPTNGYFAISAETLKLMDFNRLDKRYFFESSFLIELYYTGAIIRDIPIPARYGDEESHLSVLQTLMTFPPKLFKAFLRRIILRYYILDFSIFSIYLLIAVPLLFFGLTFGAWNWMHYYNLNITAPTGTVMIAVLSIVIGFQLLLSVIQFDFNSSLPYRGKT